jgi:formylglycine-generating enzyme required for sulfatase activity
MVLVGCASTTYTPDKPFTNTLGMKFVSVPGTEVLFCIWETRVKDYAVYWKANKGRSYGNKDWWKDPFKSHSSAFKQTDTHPVVHAAWFDAQAFCAWLTKEELAAEKINAGQRYRLPTDAEWSVAVGLGQETGDTPAGKHKVINDVYPWGKEWPPPKGAGNYNKNLNVDNFEYTSPVGSFAANSYGLHDMGGNVWEWCEDKWTPTVTGPGETWRVWRGASWYSRSPVGLLSSYRDIPAVAGRYSPIRGFRCVLTNAQ